MAVMKDRGDEGSEKMSGRMLDILWFLECFGL